MPLQIRGEVAGIEPDRADLQVEAGAGPVQARQVRRGVIDVARGDVGIDDQGVHTIDGAVIQIKEADGFLVAHHEARVGVDRAALDLTGVRRRGVRRRLGPLGWLATVPARARLGGLGHGRRPAQRLLARGGPLGIHRGVQFGQVGRRRLLDLHKFVMALVGVRLQVRAVGIEHAPADQPVFDRLLDNGVEDRLLDPCPGKAAATILAQRGGVGHLVGQAQPEKPAVGHIDLDLTHQLALGAHPEQVADEQHLEQHHGVDGRAAVVGTVEPFGLLADEVEADVGVDQPEQVITRNQLVQRHHLQFGLSGGGGRLEHAEIIKKPSPRRVGAWGFVSSLSRRQAGF